MERRKGFTLIELLVVIAIIAILAAMLFPVFARARESARKIQCLSNVKNIAMAVQIYLSDFDRFPPSEHRQEAVDFFTEASATDHGCGGAGYRASWANPYIQWPVVLDEYTKNRDVWKCPSAKLDGTALWIIPSYGGDWLKYLMDTWGSGWYCTGWSEGGSPCGRGYPPGWGGDVTDSIEQQSGNFSSAGHPGAFEGTIAAASTMLTDTKTAQVNDPSRCVVAGDGTVFGPVIQGANTIFYEMCGTGCGKADWANCSWTADCNTLDKNLVNRWATDASFRRQYTRHLGGSNVGFADGHASWYTADSFIVDAPFCNDNGSFITDGKYGGLCPT